MVWTVKVQTERGETVEPDVDIGFDEIPYGLEYPICSGVDRYAQTLLNFLQLKTFVAEWDRAAQTPEFAHLKEKRLIRDLAERVAREQLYLRFLGD